MRMDGWTPPPLFFGRGWGGGMKLEIMQKEKKRLEGEKGRRRKEEPRGRSGIGEL